MPSRFFPPDSQWRSDGLVAVGGQLSTEWLLDAYRNGIFPWPSRATDPMLWWSPNPRAILPLDGIHLSKRLKRRLSRNEFEFRMDSAFEAVICACSTGPGREEGTWLTPQMINAYTELHRRGYAHCIETWHAGQLVGGVYGIAIGGLFAAESMFFRRRDASKAAVAILAQHLSARRYQLMDVQQWTPHTGRMGVIEIPRSEYLKRLRAAVDMPVTFGSELEERR